MRNWNLSIALHAGVCTVPAWTLPLDAHGNNRINYTPTTFVTSGVTYVRTSPFPMTMGKERLYRPNRNLVFYSSVTGALGTGTSPSGSSFYCTYMSRPSTLSSWTTGSYHLIQSGSSIAGPFGSGVSAQVIANPVIGFQWCLIFAFAGSSPSASLKVSTSLVSE